METELFFFFDNTSAFGEMKTSFSWHVSTKELRGLHRSKSVTLTVDV